MGLIPQFFFDCVVAIMVDINENERRCIGSGFLYGDFIETVDDGQHTYWVYLITNRHVLENLTQIYLRFNPQSLDTPARDYPIPLQDEHGLKWFTHSNNQIDVAIIPINIQLLKQHAMQVKYFRSDVDTANIDEMTDVGIMEGDFVYVLGFPMGIVGREQNFVISRSGTIARIRDTLNRINQEYLIDAFVFPGNSGGPVVIKPEVMAIRGTKPITKAYLIGIVKSYIPYLDVAISSQTKRPRVIFEENSGLAEVHPIDFIQEVIKEHRESMELARLKKAKNEKTSS